ncbi:MAG TPA: SET domain-containing protein [Candidatus Paceibacterota bacterium]|nr:SET domain-containing protein [Candidatus Paceibacterota bacterium]
MKKAVKKRAKRKGVPIPDGMTVRRSSAGLGMFATRPYKKGEFVIEYVGRVISKKEEETSRSKYLFEVTKNKTIDGKPSINPAGYLNHSCHPNCEADVKKGRVLITAIKHVRAGDELTWDYGKEYVGEHIAPYGCRCVKHRPELHRVRK